MDNDIKMSLLERLKEVETDAFDWNWLADDSPSDLREKYSETIRDVIEFMESRKWVKIDDPVINEWKDGRPLDIIYDYLNAPETIVHDCYFCVEEDGWYNPSRSVYLITDNITHVRLPI